MPKASAIFTNDTFQFFRALARDNKKEWMDANRERYQQHVVAPFRALLEAMAPAALKLYAGFDTSGRTGTNFSRINRDTRFSKDKTPYRPQMYLLFPDASAKDSGQLYIGLAAETVTVGFRMYGMEKSDRLAALTVPRALKNMKWIAAQARRLGKKYESYWYSSEKGEWTKHDGWPTQPEEWQKIKGWIVRKQLKPVAATRASFVADAAKNFKELFPLFEFTSKANWRG
jgi:uncharacterized protein (TIGR02453 family)